MSPYKVLPMSDYTMSAPSKDDVYSELRKRGIRAIKVQERIQPVVKRGFGGLRIRREHWRYVARLPPIDSGGGGGFREMPVRVDTRGQFLVIYAQLITKKVIKRA